MTNPFIINKRIILSHSKLDSFVVYICIEGNAIIYQNNDMIELSLGDTVLVPANIKNVHIYSDSAKLLQTYI